MNIKRDKITDALEAFWGEGSKTEVPSPQVDTTPEDIVETVPISSVPQISRDIESISVQPTQSMTSGSKSIKEMVENAIKNKQNKISGQPSYNTKSEILEQYSPKTEVELRQKVMQVAPSPQSTPKGAFGFAGFDSKIADQFAKERGAGLDLGGPMAPSGGSKLESQFRGGMSGQVPMGGSPFGMGGGMRREDPRLRRRADLALDDYAKQAAISRQMRLEDLRIDRSQQLQKARLQSQLSKSVAKSRDVRAFEAGLPVYENLLDPLFGGKKQVKKPVYKDVLDTETGKITQLRTGKFTTETESTPGFFGLMAGGLNTVYDAGGKEFKRGASAYERKGGATGIIEDIEYGLSPEKRMYSSQQKAAKKGKKFLERAEVDRVKAVDAMTDLSNWEKENYERRGGDIAKNVDEIFDIQAKKAAQIKEEKQFQKEAISDIFTQFEEEGYPDDKKEKDEKQTIIEPEESTASINKSLEHIGDVFEEEDYSDIMAETLESYPNDEKNNKSFDGDTYIGYSDSFKKIEDDK